MKTPANVDLIVKNCNLFTGDRSDPHYPHGAIAIKDKLIEAVGEEKDVLRDYGSTQCIDAAGAIVHPGLIDSHLHLNSALCHNLPIDASGKRSDVPSYAKIKCENDDEITAAFTAAVAVAKLRRGYTLFVEPGTVFETDAFAEALTKVGMRGMVSAPYGWDDVSSYQSYNAGTLNQRLLDRARPDTTRVVAQLETELERNSHEDALVRGYVCLYGSGTATDVLTKEAVRLAKESAVPFIQHQAFTAAGVTAEYEKLGQSGIARLDSLDALVANTKLVHMNVLSEQDVRITLERKPGLIWCPNMPFFYGVYPEHRSYHSEFYKNGLTVSLGIDTLFRNSLGSTGTVALLVAAMMNEPLAQSDPFYMQSMDAAKNLHLDHWLGSIAIGKRADVVIRGMSDILDVPLDDRGAVIAQTSGMTAVNTVIVDGNVVMRNGTTTFVDQEKVLTDAVQQRRRLFGKALGP